MNQLYRTQLEEFRHASLKHDHHIAKTIFHFCNAIGKPQQTFKFQIQIWLRKSRNLIQKCKKRNRKPTAKHKNISTTIQETQNRRPLHKKANHSGVPRSRRRKLNNEDGSITLQLQIDKCSWHFKTVCMFWNAETHFLRHPKYIFENFLFWILYNNWNISIRIFNENHSKFQQKNLKITDRQYNVTW